MPLTKYNQVSYEILPTFRLFTIARHSFELLKEIKPLDSSETETGEPEMDEQDHHFFVGIVFSAFTVESLVNHFGNRIFKFWQEIEKITNIKAKIEILFERIGLEPNWGESPLQEINDCRCYRDYLAHSRPGTKMLSEAEQSSLSFEDVATQASRNPLVKERFKHMYENKVPSLEKLLKSVKELNKMILDNIEDIVKDENYPFDKEDDPLTSAVKVSLQGLKR